MIEIRRYHPAVDLVDELFAVLTAVYQPVPWTLEQLQLSLADQTMTYYVAAKNGEVAGFLAVQTVLDELEIIQLAVRPDYQRQGLARRLMEEIQDWPGSAFLEVRASNHSAQKLYAGQGFEAIGLRRNYYHHPMEDAILMKRSRA